MKIFKSQKPAVCGTAKRPIRRWLLPPKKQQAYRFFPLLIFMFTSGAVIFSFPVIIRANFKDAPEEPAVLTRFIGEDAAAYCVGDVLM